MEKLKDKVLACFYENTYCSARDWDRIGLLEEIPRSGVQIPALLKGPL